jgi:hypothetical protein
MTEQTELKTTGDDSSKGGEAALEKRRRLLKAGVGGGAVLATLKSRSALACTTGNCITPSAYGSINTSIPDKKKSCSGRTPGYWKESQHYGEWPRGYYPTTTTGQYGHAATLFKSCFSPDQLVPNKTLRDAMCAECGDTSELGRHVSAALLNAASGKTVGVLTVQQVKEMWTATCNGGYFHPTAGVDWNAAKVVEYLKTTMTL